ncbi:unnamed protein product [Oppiella nova]|uniref:Terpene synthase n=1 Tax=Oppiella nova TaxID=334625 RepID=A0A7R9MFP2_9ACAR|nr:unnamed protein product [Oppiella nova]CAG2176485.1 unnamed protein product [Oppiella nova]
MSKIGKIDTIVTGRKPILKMVDSIPDIFKGKPPTGANRSTIIDVNELLNYEVRGLVSDTILRNPNHPESYDWTNKLLSEAYGRPVSDTTDITCYIDMSYTTANKKVAFVINYWNIFAFMMDDHMDQIVMDDAGKQQICEWQQKYRTGKSNGKLGLDKMLVRTLEMERQYLSPDQYDRHVRHVVEWWDTYFTVNQTKYNADHQMLTYEQFWIHRGKDNAGALVFIFSELSVGLDPIEHGLTTDPIWLSFNTAAAKQSILVNEVYSVKSEVPKGQGKYSYQYLIMWHEGCSVQEAVDHIVSEIHFQWELVLDFGEQLKEYGIPVLSAYVDEVVHEVKGNHFWSTICRRYSTDPKHSHYINTGK